MESLKEQVQSCLEKSEQHLQTELLPFWLDRCQDRDSGGFLTHFDRDGRPSGGSEKSLISQTRTLYTLSASHRAGYGEGRCAEYARQGVSFLLERMWDQENHGFFWMADRQGNIKVDKKIVYGQSFAIYALSEFTLATGDPRGLEYAQETFSSLAERCLDHDHGGYLEMFDRAWTLAGPGTAGGDRKTFDVHMHLMEAFTALLECSRQEIHCRALLSLISLLCERMIHPQSGTGIPQFALDWSPCPPIRFDVVWGWDRFPEEGMGAKSASNTSYGHNVEFSWLLLHALEILGQPLDPALPAVKKILEHTLLNGMDETYGGVYVEGPHQGPSSDREKEFWQQAEVLIGMLDGCLHIDKNRYWHGFLNVHRFVFEKMIHKPVGEWWPLLTREGSPIWTHMGHTWKGNYHTVRSMIQTTRRLRQLLQRL